MRSLLLLVAVAAGPVRGAADEPKKPNYFPLAKGTKWEYAVTLADKKKQTRVVEVTETKMKDGKLIATVKGQLECVYRVDDSAVLELSADDDEYDTPIVRLKFPLKRGDKWSHKEKIEKNKFLELTWSVGEPVEVTVPAGKFKAVPIAYTEDVGGIKVTNTLHYVDGIGLARREAVFFLGTVTEELTKFTPGK